MLRAERLKVGRSFARSADVSILAGTIVGADYLGMLVRYVVDVGTLRLNVIQPLDGAAAHQEGEAVEIRIGAADWIDL